MTVQFDTWAAFWDMGGYALYVWLSFAVTLSIMLFLVVKTRLSAHTLKAEAMKNEMRESRILKAKSAKLNTASSDTKTSENGRGL